jgi:hypothetical protein
VSQLTPSTAHQVQEPWTVPRGPLGSTSQGTLQTLLACGYRIISDPCKTTITHIDRLSSVYIVEVLGAWERHRDDLQLLHVGFQVRLSAGPVIMTRCSSTSMNCYPEAIVRSDVLYTRRNPPTLTAKVSVLVDPPPRTANQLIQSNMFCTSCSSMSGFGVRI